MSRKKDRSDLALFIHFLLVHDYLFDDPTSLKYICKGFQVFFCYILGVKVTDLVSLKGCLMRMIIYTYCLGFHKEIIIIGGDIKSCFLAWVTYKRWIDDTTGPSLLSLYMKQRRICCVKFKLWYTVLVIIKLTKFAVALRLHCGSCKLIFWHHFIIFS